MSGYPHQQFPGSQAQPPAKAISGNPFAEQVNPYAAPQVAGYQPNMPGAIQMAMTEEWFARRRMRMLIAWGIALFGIVLGVGAGVLHENLGDSTPLIVFLGFVLALGALIYGLIACRMVTPQRITDQYVWIKGVHPDFLNRLEVWMWNV